MNEGAETFGLTLTRSPGQPWGFRLQGGSDFTTPLSVQMVNPGSLAEQFGVRSGDAVLQINNTATEGLAHEAAKNEIVRSGDQVSLLLQRGAVKIWKPQVTAMSDLRPDVPSGPQPGFGDDSYIQKTSLAADKAPVHHIGSAHNRAARPFGAASEEDKGLVHAQYNSPINMYSQQNVTDTYEAHAETLPDSVARVVISEDVTENSNNNNTDTENKSVDKISGGRLTPSPTPVRRSPSPVMASPTYLAVLESEKSGGSKKDDDRLGSSNPNKQSRSFRLLQQGLNAGEVRDIKGVVGGSVGGGSEVMPSGMRSVRAPVTKAPSEIQQAQHMTCKNCGSLIVGVFVRIQGEPLHPECFKCCQCGINLKNQGHFVIDKRLYCETHAREAAQANAPGPDMVAVPVYR